MRTALGLGSGRRQGLAFVFAVALSLGGLLGSASAQVPLPMQEQVQMFNSLPASQQQALIRELQRQLPPAERDAMLSALQGQLPSGQGQQQQPQFNPQSLATLDGVLRDQSDAEKNQEKNPRFKPNDTLVLEFSQRKDAPQIVRVPDDQQKLEDFQRRLEKGNPYQLDGAGQLLLPGVNAMSLAGLTVDQATVRVQAETSLKPFTIVLTLLPLEPVGTKALKPFGYDLFDQRRTTESTTTRTGLTSLGLGSSTSPFQPSTDIPVPVDYVIGPGDSVNIQLFGNQNQDYRFTVSRDGTITFPEIGPVNVSGLTLRAAPRADLRSVCSEQMIGVRASSRSASCARSAFSCSATSCAPARIIVSGLSTMTNALYASGGVKPVGSLRSIALRRDGKTVSTFDLYDLLLRGDTRARRALEPGDAIFVPPVGRHVAVDGEVRRPAIYEVKGERDRLPSFLACWRVAPRREPIELAPGASRARIAARPCKT